MKIQGPVGQRTSSLAQAVVGSHGRLPAMEKRIVKMVPTNHLHAAFFQVMNGIATAVFDT